MNTQIDPFLFQFAVKKGDTPPEIATPEQMRVTFEMETKEIDMDKKEFTAIASTEARDSSGDIIMQNGWMLERFLKNPIIPWAHRYDLPPVGKAVKTWVDKKAKALMIRVKFANTDFAKQIFQMYAEGFMKAFSVGFIPKKWEQKKEQHPENPDQSIWTRFFLSQELLEVSAVPVPANAEALKLSVQKGIVTEEEAKEIFDFSKAPPPPPEEDDEDEECSVSEKLAKIFTENHEIMKDYRKALAKMRQLLGVITEEDEQKQIALVVDGLKEFLIEDEKVKEFGGDNKKTPDLKAPKKTTSSLTPKARPATEKELKSIMSRAVSRA